MNFRPTPTFRLSRHQTLEQEDDDPSLSLPEETRQQLLGAVFGHALGDAIGLLSEFMSSKDAHLFYEQQATSAEGVQLNHKVPDLHRERWTTGDWTEDTDQMVVIMRSLTETDGILDETNVASKLKEWANRGFPELGDVAGLGIGATTRQVLRHPQFDMVPAAAAEAVWRANNRDSASNGAVMRTSILGIHDCWKIHQVISNVVKCAAITHSDPRCLASCIAVSVALANLMQGKKDVKQITEQVYKEVISNVSFNEKQHKKQLKKHLFVRKLSELRLDESGKMSYTYKAMGAGFWALRQKDFRAALTDIVLAGGDADTNGAIAGALLGCKLGYNCLPADWLVNLKHKKWLHKQVRDYAVSCRPHIVMMATDAEEELGACGGTRAAESHRPTPHNTPTAPRQPPPYNLYPEEDLETIGE